MADKRNWFLNHMTPLGMGLGKRQTDTQPQIAPILVGGLLAVGILIAAYLNLT